MQPNHANRVSHKPDPVEILAFIKDGYAQFEEKIAQQLDKLGPLPDYELARFDRDEKIASVQRLKDTIASANEVAQQVFGLDASELIINGEVQHDLFSDLHSRLVEAQDICLGMGKSSGGQSPGYFTYLITSQIISSLRSDLGWLVNGRETELTGRGL